MTLKSKEDSFSHSDMILLFLLPGIWVELIFKKLKDIILEKFTEEINLMSQKEDTDNSINAISILLALMIL